MIGEEWKDIKGYEGLYQVSNIGNVRSIRRCIKYKSGSIAIHKGRLLRQYERTGGYMYVVLSKENTQKPFRVHRLVADAFVENPKNMEIVNHIDENRKNNSATNLEWCDLKYNINYGTRTERAIETRRNHSKPFICHETGDVFRSIADCKRKLNLPKTAHVSCVLNGHRNSTHGYHFSYTEIEP